MGSFTLASVADRAARCVVLGSFALVGCAGAAKAPAGNAGPRTAAGVAQTTFPLRPGDGVDLAIPSIAAPPPAFAIGGRPDLALAWTTDGTFALTGPDGLTTTCDRSPCLLQLALTGVYFAEASGEWHGPPPSPIQVTASALPLPAASALVPGGAPVELRPAPVAPGDPRGPIADASLHLPITAGVQLEISEPAARAPDPEGLMSRLALTVAGPGGIAMTMSGPSTTTHGALEVSFDGLPGDYTIRAGGDVGLLRVVALPLGPVVNPPSALEPARPPPPSTPVLTAGRRRGLVIGPAPEPPSVWIDVAAGSDLAFSWSGPVTSIGLTRPETEAACGPSPCVETRWPAGATAVSVAPGAGAVQAHARLWPLPAAAGVLRDGESIELTTSAAAADDPRGPLAEVELVLDRGGTFLVEARDLDWVAPADWHDAHLPAVTEFAADGAAPEHPFGLLTGGDQLRDGIGLDMFDLEGSARVIVRLDGRGPRPPRRLRVTVKHQ